MMPKNASVKGSAPIKSNKGNGKAAGLNLNADAVGGNGNAIVLMNNGRTLTLTIDDLTQAIRTSIDHIGMPEEQARAMAQHVMNFFGYSERIIDNILEPEDRDAFYMLEDTGILTTEREETTLYDGREWRIHYWLFRKERIFELIAGDGSNGLGVNGVDSVYDEVPDEVWQRVNN
jgi:hypothetical protein